MFFGPVPLSQAEGAILAHSLALPEGRLRKGLRLSADHLSRMAAAGLESVVVAIPAKDDLEEDTAALQIASAAAGPGVELRVVGTGRVNLHARGPGLAQLRAGQILAANAVDPMLTIATVPDLHRLEPGGMIATVKVISYAVAGAAVAGVAEAIAGAVSLAPPVWSEATLIETEIAGQDAGAKGARVTEARLARLGLAMAPKISAAHDSEALARAIAAAPGTGPLLILTASATSDPQDVGPAALRLAGGQVTRVGMPVDPGNLLFLGAFQGRPVIGLPGCARSPALNGADWVLERICCGIEVSARDIAAMGLGGLLVEMPSRPHPRMTPKGP
ncbi:molybdopterin-binding protein [Falsigemmobacter faecalis]|uniref:Molybdopterin biosynthesis protein n=1 Tax=Falsigemmobacter faecalis TaxID=2488730 RepID=A0A3P3DML7_9RHOB|nr:molybdopterin-binding protein [Falsigemmobacter faecalis]RRH75174.1 molybdopterin biosynthesis protein [Falsigemmobacter faecalis]